MAFATSKRARTGHFGGILDLVGGVPLDKNTVFTSLTPAQKTEFKANVRKILRELKQSDFAVAVDIAAHANQKLRDKLGNILPDIWSRNSSDAETATGQLTSQEDIQTYMREMLKEHVEANKSLLVKCDNDTLCTWILGFVTSWEHQYKKTENRYDISEHILSAMSEAVQFVTPCMQGTVLDVDALELRYAEEIHPHRAYLPVLGRQPALVRFYFRHPCIAKYMVLVAGKLLQRRECNRSGVYCSTRQRNDVARELDRAVSDLRIKLQSFDHRQARVGDEWLWYALDHRKLDFWQDGVPVSVAPGSVAASAPVVSAAPGTWGTS
jgi:histone H3/H4